MDDPSHLGPCRGRKILLYGLDSLFLLSLLIPPAIWFFGPVRFFVGPLKISSSDAIRPLVLVFLLLMACLIARARFSRMNEPIRGFLGISWIKKTILALFSVYLSLGGMEWVLTLAGFERQMAPVIFSLESEDGVVEETEGYGDPELLWKFRPDEEYHKIRINNLGYRDREVDPGKPEGAKRVIAMGDSCTAAGFPPYSQILHTMLTNSPPTDASWEAFNMAVYGYSIVQGLKVFQMQGRALKPDIVTLYFGWNDHWLEMQTDASRMATRVHPFYGYLYERLKNKRLFMFISWLGNRAGGFEQKRKEPGLRVPLEQYRTALRRFIRDVRAVGAQPLVITAPRRVVKEGEKVEFDGVETDFSQVHDQYVEITRQTAREQDADLLDLHKMLTPAHYDSYFNDDGIHLRQEGLFYIAKALDHKIQEMATDEELD